MKNKWFIALAALTLSAAVAAQEPAQVPARNRTGEGTQERVRVQDPAGNQAQVQNYGQEMSAQKQARNEERKLLKKQEKEMKKQQKQLKNQQAAGQGGAKMGPKDPAAAQAKGAKNASKQMKAAKAAKGSGAGRK